MPLERASLNNVTESWWNVHETCLKKRPVEKTSVYETVATEEGRESSCEQTHVTEKEKSHSQKGGFLASLLVPAIAALGSILAHHRLPRRN